MKHTFVVLSLSLLAACATDAPVDVDAGNTNSQTPGADLAVEDSGRTPDMSTGPDLSTPDVGNPVDEGTPPEDVGSMPDQGAPVDMSTADTSQPNTPGETCETATDATAGGTFTGDTTGGDDDYSVSASDSGCPSGAVSGPDHVYSVTPAAETTYRIVVEPEATFDPFLYVKSDCALDECVDGTVLNGEGTMESLTVTVPAGQTYFIIVDGELLSEGAYTLTVEQT